MIKKVFLFFFMACVIALGWLACSAYAGNGIDFTLQKIEKYDNYLHGPWLEKKSEKIAVRVSWRETAKFRCLEQYLDIADWLMENGWDPQKWSDPPNDIQVKIKVYLNERGRKGYDETVISKISPKAVEEKLRISFTPGKRNLEAVKKTLQKITKTVEVQ